MSTAFQRDEDQFVSGFRAEARSWLTANFPPVLAEDPRRQVVEVHGAANVDPDYLLWKSRMAEKGWGVPTWPIRYGGGGLEPTEARILGEEMARIGAINPIVGMSVSLIGPTLLEYGDEVQKLTHLPPAARGETRWCQGYSEPGAGSDLASLQTRAEDRGDHFLVNGQKVWTSGAQFADWCFCLVRTDTTRKHDGISFLLIDMRTPGIEVRPILLIYGGSTFNEVFFTDVVVPKDNLVGPLNGGWTIGKRLLQFERVGAGTPRRAPQTRPLPEVAKSYVGIDATGRLADPDLRARLTDYEINALAVTQTSKRLAEEARAGHGAPAGVAIMKNATVAANQARLELLVEMMGYRGLGWEGEPFAEEELIAVRTWLTSKSASIWGGTNEIQWNIVSKRFLGLPDPVQRER